MKTLYKYLLSLDDWILDDDSKSDILDKLICFKNVKKDSIITIIKWRNSEPYKLEIAIFSGNVGKVTKYEVKTVKEVLEILKRFV